MKFNTSKYEATLIARIVKRAIEEGHFTGKPLTLTMDLESCHCNGCPLELHELLTSKTGDFIHDISGIQMHINRETGQLGGCFDPRCSLKL